MASINDINERIMFGDFTNDQLNSITMAIKYRRNLMTKVARNTFGLGASVKFYNPKVGQTYTGRVDKVGRKFLTVRTSTNQLWRVPGSMLEEAQ